jgi:hypothetical protein
VSAFYTVSQLSRDSPAYIWATRGQNKCEGSTILCPEFTERHVSVQIKQNVYSFFIDAPQFSDHIGNNSPSEVNGSYFYKVKEFLNW